MQRHSRHRKIAIVLTAAALIAGASISAASARGGHGGAGHTAGVAHTGGVGFSGARSSAFRGSSSAFRGNRAAFAGRFGFRHRFHRRFFFVGAPYASYGYDDCYARVWTHWGWRWRNVCY